MVDLPNPFPEITGFEWDEGNSTKNWEMHRVSQAEAEQVFFTQPLRIARDWEHSAGEERYAALGQTFAGRRLTIVFTLRGSLIRVISARDMSRRERRIGAQEAEAE
jgi:uncharacterized DUF497 family protein